MKISADQDPMFRPAGFTPQVNCGCTGGSASVERGETEAEHFIKNSFVFETSPFRAGQSARPLSVGCFRQSADGATVA